MFITATTLVMTLLPPPMTVTVHAAPGISPALVRRALAEAEAIWRASAVQFVWRIGPMELALYATSTESGSYVPATLQVTIDDDHGVRHETAMPVGWIAFEDETTPMPLIHISRANAQALMELSRSSGDVAKMTGLEREVLLGRAMGRALAHELGHYLLASKVHTPTGLMKARRSTAEFFSNGRPRFDLDPEQRGVVAQRLRQERLAAQSVAATTPGS